MNIAFFLKPKCDIAYLYDDVSFRQGLKKMKYYGYTSIPVITRSGKYVGTISEGDFLWNVVDCRQDELHKVNLKDIENVNIKDVLHTDRNPPVGISASMEELLIKSTNQNYVPVVDDTNSFVGIITRKDIIKYFYQQVLTASK
jgi:CBS domain-containing protein